MQRAHMYAGTFKLVTNTSVHISLYNLDMNAENSQSSGEIFLQTKCRIFLTVNIVIAIPPLSPLLRQRYTTTSCNKQGMGTNILECSWSRIF